MVEGKKNKQIHALTGLRFFTAYHIVMFHHSEAALASWPIWLKNILAGPGGVGLFFVLSGFILTYVYSRAFESSKKTTRDFLAIRLARIYPTYFLGLLITSPFFFPAFFENSSFITATIKAAVTVVPSLLLVQAWLPPIALSWNGPDWAVSAMFFFYLVFPLSLSFFRKLTRLQLLGATLLCVLLTIIPAATVLKFPIPEIAWQEGLRAFPLTRLPEFLLGVGLGKLFLTRQSTALSSMGAWVSSIGTVVTLVVMGIGLDLPYFIYKPLLVFGFGLLIYGLALGGGFISWLLSRKTIVLLGHAGFPLYIFSLPIWGYTTRFANATGLFDPSSLLFFIFYSALLTLFSVAVLLFYENPLRTSLTQLVNRQLKRFETSRAGNPV